MPTTKQKADLVDSFELLGHHLKDFEGGRTLSYLPMAVELRKLLCESLAQLVIPDFKLYKLHLTKLLKETPTLIEGLEHFIPGSLEINDQKVMTLRLKISEDKKFMEVSAWTQQVFFKEGVTIHELIKSVADKEAAHSDPADNAALSYTKDWVYNDISCRILGIYSIARLVYDIFENEYKNTLIPTA